MSDVVIRSSRPDDGAALRAIEWEAGERFRAFGLDSVADDEPASIEELAEYAIDGRSWLALDAAGDAVGYVIADVVDGNAHVEQVSVRPSHQGLGIGRALIERVQTWAADTGRTAITLTTFADIPFNGPLYAHLGFRVLPDAEIGPELRAIREHEAAHGLDAEIRVCMQLDLDTARQTR